MTIRFRGQPVSPFMLFLLPATIFTVAIFLAPLGAVVMRSFFDQGFSFDKYQEVLGSKLFYKVLWNTIVISVTATCVTLVLAYPMAYHLARQPARRRTLT